MKALKDNKDLKDGAAAAQQSLLLLSTLITYCFAQIAL